MEDEVDRLVDLDVLDHVVVTNVNASSRMCSMFASEPVSRLSTQMTRWPSREEVLAEMGAEEPGSAGDDCARHEGAG